MTSTNSWRTLLALILGQDLVRMLRTCLPFTRVSQVLQALNPEESETSLLEAPARDHLPPSPSDQCRGSLFFLFSSFLPDFADSFETFSRLVGGLVARGAVRLQTKCLKFVRGLLGTDPPDPTCESASPFPPRGSIWHRFDIDSISIS